MEELGIMADEKTYLIVINGLCMKGDLEGVLALLGEMGRREIELGSVTYNTVINGLCKTGRTDKADNISWDFHGDNYTYFTLLYGFMKEKDATGVMEMNKRLEEARVVTKIRDSESSARDKPEKKISSFSAFDQSIPYITIHMRIEKDWMIHCKKLEHRSSINQICSSKEETNCSLCYDCGQPLRR